MKRLVVSTLNIVIYRAIKHVPHTCLFGSFDKTRRVLYHSVLFFPFMIEVNDSFQNAPRKMGIAWRGVARSETSYL